MTKNKNRLQKYYDNLVSEILASIKETQGKRKQRERFDVDDEDENGDDEEEKKERMK